MIIRLSVITHDVGYLDNVYSSLCSAGLLGIGNHSLVYILF